MIDIMSTKGVFLAHPACMQPVAVNSTYSEFAMLSFDTTVIYMHYFYC